MSFGWRKLKYQKNKQIYFIIKLQVMTTQQHILSFVKNGHFFNLKNDQNTVNACQIFKFVNLLKKKYRLK